MHGLIAESDGVTRHASEACLFKSSRASSRREMAWRVESWLTQSSVLMRLHLKVHALIQARHVDGAIVLGDNDVHTSSAYLNVFYHGVSVKRRRWR